MSALRITWVVAGVLCLMATGCQNKVYEENQQLHQQNRELQARLSEEDARLQSAPDPSQLAKLQSELSARDAKIKELQDSLTHPTPGGPADPTLEGIQTTYDPKAGTITVNLPGDVLFDSGKAVIKSSATATLDKIVAALKKDYSGKKVLVEGFTDSDPITRTKDQWDDNWDLSYGRAKSVMQYLTGHGVDSAHLAIVANGANHPKANKAGSRRVEIVVSVR